VTEGSVGPIKFPDEPIRVGPRPGDWDFPTSDEQAELDDGTDERECWTCGGDGYAECDEWDCMHPSANGRAHLATCPNCRGSGDAKDVWYW
jgi:hypothetical protein